MSSHALAGFALAMVPIVLTPGASFTLMATHVLAAERAVVRRVIAGTALGILSHALLAAFGLAVLVMRSAELYRLLQLAGAAYLVALGVVSLVARRDDALPSEVRPGVRTRTAFLANLLNPKAAAVYLTIVPQFLDRTEFTVLNVVALACVHAALTAAWLAASGTALRSLRRHRLNVPAQAIRRVGGVVLITLGLKSMLLPRNT